MTHSVSKLASRFKALGAGAGENGPVEPARGGEYLKRARRRRLDLKTLHGTARESSRVYRELAEGKINLLEAETRSRILRRHSEILTALEQRDQVVEIQAQLAALQSGRSALTLDTDTALTESVQTESGNSLISVVTE